MKTLEQLEQEVDTARHRFLESISKSCHSFTIEKLALAYRTASDRYHEMKIEYLTKRYGDKFVDKLRENGL
jgi:hypothetical protein